MNKPLTDPKIVRIHESNIDEIMRDLTERYEAGELTGLVVAMLLTDNTFHTTWGGDEDFTFLKQVGMAQTMVHDIIDAPNRDD